MTGQVSERDVEKESASMSKRIDDSAFKETDRAAPSGVGDKAAKQGSLL